MDLLCNLWNCAIQEAQSSEHIMCKLTFNASGQPIVINDDIQCVLTQVLPPPEQSRHGTARSRLTTGSTRGGTAEINPAKEVKKIGTRMHTSCVGRTTKAKAPKESLRESNTSDQQTAMPSTMSQTSANNSLTSTGRGGRTHARIAEEGEDSPNVLYLNLNVHVVELEAYQAECPTDSGFYIPQDAAAAQNDQFQATVAQEAALPPQELRGVVPQQEQEQLMETETPFFYNFRDPSALDDFSTSSIDTGAGAAGQADVTEAVEAAEEAAQEAKRASLLQDPESQELISRVMENTVFNLLQEASHGEFNIKVMPKRFLVAS